MRPLVSRLSQVVRPIALDQSSKILYQSRITSRSPLVGVLHLPAQRALFAPNYFARYQIRAQHTSPDAQTTGKYKKNKTPLGKHYGTPVTTGEIHGTHYGLPIASGKVDRKLKTTGRSSQTPKAMYPSAHLFAEKELYRNFEQLLQEYKYMLRREKADGDLDVGETVLILLLAIIIVQCGYIMSGIKKIIPTEDEKLRRHRDISSPTIASPPYGKNKPS